ncbi:MAG: hypothetical protein AUK35_05065 [Zetaproteobacteria bacterium CG2_30_46_52]|nr:MAG: hypothetical protein AUK35_05065 [Zetaproteobacteria bacterium CG2_30_46_52]
MLENHSSIRKFPKGTVILHEGEFSDDVYIILSGRVSVTRCPRPKMEVLLAELGEGETFGELSMFDGAANSATVRASEDVQVRVLSKDQLLEVMQTDASSVQVVLHSWFRRLSGLTKRVMELENRVAGFSAEGNKDFAVKAGAIAISGLTEPAKHALDDLAVVMIDSFPYRIGRYSKHQPSNLWFFGGSSRNHLDIHDISPYVVSRQHCRIEKRGKDMYLVDQDSRLGTWVDGKKNEGLTKDSVLLTPGTHTIHIGDAKSPFAFGVIVP